MTRYFIAFGSLFLMAFAHAASTSAAKHLNDPPEWYRSEEAKTIAANVLSFQAATGCWPKKLDTAAQAYIRDPAALHATYDNKAATDELRFLARMFNATKDEAYEKA